MKGRMPTLVSCVISAIVLSASIITYESANAENRMDHSPDNVANAPLENGSTDKYYKTKGPDWEAVEKTALGEAPDISQQFSAQNLPDVIVINQHTADKNSGLIQPRLDYLEITELRIAEDGKTVSFNIKNNFNRPNAKPIRIGGLMLTAMVRYDYDSGAESHNSILFKENRLELKKGVTKFTTDPGSYPSVLEIESLRFFMTPPIDSMMKSVAQSIASQEVPEGTADISQEFSVDDLPELIVFDQNTIEQHAAARDPRLSYLRIKDLKVGADEKTISFNIQNNFGRRLQEPIHIGELMLTAKARYDYDDSAEPHGTILLSVKHAILEKGDNHFTTDPSLYSNIVKLDSLQFFFGIR